MKIYIIFFRVQTNLMMMTKVKGLNIIIHKLTGETTIVSLPNLGIDPKCRYQTPK